MIVMGLFAGVVPARAGTGERQRWLFYAISNVGFLIIWYILIAGGRKGMLGFLYIYLEALLIGR